jgi:hypothetical protein
MWYNLLDRIAHTIECKSPKCLFKVTPAFRKGTRSSFERVYIPTLHTLRESGTPDSKALNLWERIARDLEVSEASVRCKWRVEKQCCNPECPKRKLSNVKVMACVRCQSVFYCGRTCQKR